MREMVALLLCFSLSIFMFVFLVHQSTENICQRRIYFSKIIKRCFGDKYIDSAVVNVLARCFTIFLFV